MYDEAVTEVVTFNNEAVIELSTVSRLRVALDPLTISFFQFGILLLYYGWLQVCLPTSPKGL